MNIKLNSKCDDCALIMCDVLHLLGVYPHQPFHTLSPAIDYSSETLFHHVAAKAKTKEKNNRVARANYMPKHDLVN